MTKQYDEVLQDAQNFVIYNQAETTYDLIRRYHLHFCNFALLILSLIHVLVQRTGDG